MPAKLKNAHAEITTLDKAKELGETPYAIGTSRPICATCVEEITKSGGIIRPDKLSAIWPD